LLRGCCGILFVNDNRNSRLNIDGLFRMRRWFFVFEAN
jgi:hypothetical protein